MAEGDSSHYEVSIKIGSRWEIQGRYPVTRKDDAVAEAKSLEQTTGAMVKVSRETFDSGSGLYNEVLVYRTLGAGIEEEMQGGGKPKPPRRDFSPSFFEPDDEILEFDEDGFLLGEGDEEEEDEWRPKKKRKKAKSGGHKDLGLRVLIMTLLSLFISGSVTWIVSSSAQKLNTLQRTLNLASHQDVLMAVFLGLFVISFLALTLVLLSDYISPPAPAKKGKRKPVVQPAAKSAAKSKEEAVADWLKDRQPEDGAVPEGEAEAAALPEEEEAAAMEEMEPEEVPEEPAEEEPEPIEEEPAEEEPEPIEEEHAEEVAEPEGLSESGGRQREQMQAFMRVVMSELSEGGQKLDTFNRFGVSLYLAGAVESLANDMQLEKSETTAILGESVAMIGTSPDQANRFAASYDSYLLNSRYMEMFETGRMAVNGFLEGDRDGSRRLVPSLQAWNKPKKTEEAPTGAVAVMFTDMVGSTDLNQTVGDVAAQTVVHTHNRIVRGVLADYFGREVKHTGDGIMASFQNTANAVKAGIVIQKRVLAYNRSETDIPLHLRIGINVGEPIQENDDLFGVTVQVSARLCAAAKTDQVLVSEAVKALCAGKDIKFTDCGTRNLKGVSEPVHVFEPVWGDGQD